VKQRQMIAEQEIVALLRARLPGVLAVHALGSRERGSATADSDLDLAVLVEGYADLLELWELSGTLAQSLGHEVDLLDLRAASTVMQYQVLTTGRRLWARDTAAGLFESYVLTEKLEFDAARRGLLSDIEREGSVHGR
jgi:uncharacterized protein